MTSRNFGFLAPEYAILATLGANAEALARQDPTSALVKLRQFGEQLTIAIAASGGIQVDSRDKQVDLIKTLGTRLGIPRSLQQHLHELRRSGNSAVHDLEGSTDDVSRLLPTAFSLGRWFRVKFAPHLSAPPEEYVPVEALADASKDLHAQLQELQRLVQERPAQIATESLSEIRAEFSHDLERLGNRWTNDLSSLREQLDRLASMSRDAEARAALAERAVQQLQEVSEAEARERAASGYASTQPQPGAALSKVQAPRDSAPSSTRPIRPRSVKVAQAAKCHVEGCGAPMEPITASRAAPRHSVEAGDALLRCSRYPDCTGWRKAEAPVPSGRRARGARPLDDVVHGPEPWWESGQRTGWRSEFVHCGGRLRSLSWLDNLSAPERRALCHTAIYSTGSDEVDEQVPGATVIAAVVRKVLGRGVLPPVDPETEELILERAGLLSSNVPSANPGDSSRVLDLDASLPSDDALHATLRYREPFVADPAYSSLAVQTPRARWHSGQLLAQVADAGSSLGAGHWCHRDSQLPRNSTETEEERPPLSLLFSSPDALFGLQREGEGDPSATAATRRLDAQLNRLGGKLYTVGDKERAPQVAARVNTLLKQFDNGASPPPDLETFLLLWGPVVANRVVLAMAHAIEQGWLAGTRWSIALDEPLGIGERALLSAVEFVSAVAAVWAPDAIPREVVARCNGESVRIDVSGDGVFTLAPDDHASPNDVADDSRDVHIRIEPFAGPLHALPDGTGHQIVVRSTLLPFPLVDSLATGSARTQSVGEQAIPRWALVRALRFIFAKTDFLPEGPHPRGQEIAIRRVLSGQDCVVLLPTGAGKSLIYQLSGLLTPGLTLVVDPLVALIEDQLDGLERQGIDRAVGISSQDSKSGEVDTKLARIQQGDAYFVFVAPERMQQRRFRESLHNISSQTPISLAVVDESHCVSEWGHDFRTAYLDIGRVLRTVGADDKGLSPPLLALTGTASRSVLKDMLIELDVDRSDPHVIVSPQSFDRPELRFAVVRARNEEAMGKIAGTIQGLPTRFRSLRVPRAAHEFLRSRGQSSNSGIVFCTTVDGPYGMQAISRALQDSLRIRVVTYAGKKPKAFDGDFERVKRDNASRFKANKETVLVATKSFGMGIDKPNVRFVVHAGIPASIEGYYQEAGRAGRDRREAVCVIVDFPYARRTQQRFHRRTFSGSNGEVDALNAVMASLLPLDPERESKVAFGPGDDSKVVQERALHRLRLLGVVEDFTTDWSKRSYEVRVRNAQLADVDRGLVEYVRRNQPGRVADFERRLADVTHDSLPERVSFCGRLLITYVYETIVTSRVRALDEMTRLADEGTSDEVIRDRILRYLALSPIASAIEALLDRESFGFAEWCEKLDALETQEDARDWRGATARLLEADPDNPGLLLGRGVAEAAFVGGNERLFATSLREAFKSAANLYSVPPAELGALAVWLSAWLDARTPAWKSLVHLAAQEALASGAAEVLGPMERRELVHDDPDPGTLAVILERRLFVMKHQLTDTFGIDREIA